MRSCDFLSTAVVACVVAATSVSAFQVPQNRFIVAPQAVVRQTIALGMFSGAGAGMPAEDNKDEQEAIQKAAASMGMTVEEYQLGMRARLRLTETLDTAKIVVSNDSKSITITRDANNPPKTFEVELTDEGKAAGADALSTSLCTLMKQGNEKSRESRTAAQKEMMTYIADEMKKMGKA
jgi:hypothetical protein